MSFDKFTGARWALRKRPENLTDEQSTTLLGANAAAKLSSTGVRTRLVPLAAALEARPGNDLRQLARMARQTWRLDQLRHVLRMWRRMALMTEQDPDGHRQMLATAAEVQRTGRPRSGSVLWSDLKAELSR